MLIDKVVATASEVWRVSPQVIRSKNRTEAVLKARYSVYHYLVCVTGLTLSEAGAALGLDHGTIGNGIRRLSNWTSGYPNVKRQFDEFCRRLAV